MSKRKESSGFNVWRSYSRYDAGLLMLFVLIMCVSLFQAQKSYDEKLAEQEERAAMQAQYTSQLDEQRTTVEEQQTLLQDQEEQLSAQQQLLDEQAEKLAAQQATLEEQQEKITTQQATLESQEQELASQRTTLAQQEEQLAQQKTDLAEQQSALEEQAAQVQEKQEQLDRIVGVKAEVIEELRNEFTGHNISVDIDEQTGALLLDANVMFDYDDTALLEEGEEVLSQILPDLLSRFCWVRNIETMWLRLSLTAIPIPTEIMIITWSFPRGVLLRWHSICSPSTKNFWTANRSRCFRKN